MERRRAICLYWGGAWENCSLPDAELWASAVFPDFTTAARCIFGL